MSNESLHHAKDNESPKEKHRPCHHRFRHRVCRATVRPSDAIPSHDVYEDEDWENEIGEDQEGENTAIGTQSNLSQTHLFPNSL